MQQAVRYIRWFEDIKIEDIPLVGGKNASLGEMYRELTNQGVKIPNGFAVSAEAYWYVIESQFWQPGCHRVWKTTLTFETRESSSRFDSKCRHSR
jgi:phosphoenolpyruvate synthase/pyruvate phosphate dikinase